MQAFNARIVQRQVLLFSRADRPLLADQGQCCALVLAVQYA
ncbi:hypothetical protein ALP75_200406 [Pseudomonas syringae pv. actinidiae]|nr:hypothetical protein ALP75_200406 [Pseudomonas syringae pv. actinidiae]